MTAINKTVEEIESDIKNIESQISVCIGRNDESTANTLKKYLALSQDELKKKTELKKPVIEYIQPEAKSPTEPVKGDASNNSVSTDNNIAIIDLEGKDLDYQEHYKFLSKNAFIYFDTLKRQLNQYLRNWVNKKSKEPHNKLELTNKVSEVLLQIHEAIDRFGVEKHKELLRQTTYSIGIPNDKRRYCFDIDQLKKDFEF